MILRDSENAAPQYPDPKPPVLRGEPALSAGRAVLFKAILLTLTLVLCLGIAEIGLRIAGVAATGPQYGDPVLGFGPARNAYSTFYFAEYGGMLTMKTNSLGFFEDADTAPVKAPGTYRVAVVGDSQTAGECANSESYPNVLERMLNGSRNTESVELINAGAGRYSPYQYLVKTKTKILPLKPDHLIVGIYAGNDFMDLLRPDDRPYLVIKPDGGIEHHRPDFSILDDPDQPPSLFASSRVVSFMRPILGPTVLYQIQRAKMLVHDASGHENSYLDVAKYMLEVKQLTDISLGFMTQSLLQQVWFQHFPKTLPSAFLLNKYVMKQFRELCAANGIRLTYVIIPTKLEIEPEQFADVLDKIARHNKSMTIEKLQAFEAGLRAETVRSCNELGIEVVDLQGELSTRRAGRRFYNPQEMHLTVAGNRAVALILYETLGKSIRERTESVTAGRP
jgi:hypothetical protein